MCVRKEKPVYTSRFSRILIPVLAVCLVCLFVIAAPLFHARASSAHNGTASHASPAAISTSCPPAGTARAASLPPMQLGHDQNIVYIVNEGSPTPTFGTLKRYDVVTGAKVEIIKMPGTSISSA